MGLFGGLLSTPALASSEPLPEPVKEPTLAEVLAMGNTCEGTDVHLCTECEVRNEMREGVRSNHYFAVEEEELWSELECWFQGHMDNHDLIVQGAKNKVLAQWKATGKPTNSVHCAFRGPTGHSRDCTGLLERPVRLTLDYA
jgi:hypothetical protein